MRKYNIVEPEVIVGLGEKTVFSDIDNSYSEILKLHIHLEDWLGDDLVVISNFYVVTDVLKEGLEQSELSGFEFVNIEVTKDECFNINFNKSRAFPSFWGMKITGVKGKDDVYVNSLELNVSEEFMTFLKGEYQVHYLVVNPEYDKELDDFIMSLINRDRNS
ncbi:hypothetical protein [Myroides sp. N17-2]|uniref:hypothetical protein n=1 Tax=Myroides sp. N17-2 TaxID=2030799 RepID=UPI000EFACF57|nr:hypothetical protein [Myroides sp. N17-2]